MTLPVIILVALVSISAIVAVMLAVAWHDLGQPRHARTWSAAFALSGLVWALPFLPATGLLPVEALYVLMPGVAGVAAATIAIGFRQRAGLRPWAGGLLGLAFGHGLVLVALRIGAAGVGWVAPLAAFNAAMFALAARTLRGRRRGERAAERVAEAGLALLTVLNLLALAGVLAAGTGLITLRLERLAFVTVMLLPGIIGGIGLFTIILLTADLADQTRRLAATDMLTGLLNRRGFDAAAQALLGAARRSARQAALVLIDVDHFKALNDRFGHPAGDRVLRQVCGRIAQGIGRRDIFARVGGEEFALILTDVDLQAALCAVEVLRAQVEGMPLDLPLATHVTASFGVAELKGEEALADLLLRADQALYRSKAEGRNRVTIAA